MLYIAQWFISNSRDISSCSTSKVEKVEILHHVKRVFSGQVVMYIAVIYQWYIIFTKQKVEIFYRKVEKVERYYIMLNVCILGK